MKDIAIGFLAVFAAIVTRSEAAGPLSPHSAQALRGFSPPVSPVEIEGRPRSIRCDAQGNVEVLAEIVPPQQDEFYEKNRRVHLWRLTPKAGPHPAEALLKKRGRWPLDWVSPDGRTGVLRTKTGQALVSLETGNVLVDAPAIAAKIGLGENGHPYAISENGRWSVWSGWSDEGREAKHGIALFDRATNKIVAGPRGFTRPAWVSHDGKLFSAKVAPPGVERDAIVELDGTVVFPKGRSVSLNWAELSASVDGKRLLVSVFDGERRKSFFQVYALPAWRLLAEYPNDDERPATLTPDGKFLLVAGVRRDGVSPHTLVEVDSGRVLDVGKALSGADTVPIVPCDAPPFGRFVLVDVPPDEKAFFVRVVDLAKLLGAGKKGDPNELLAGDPTRAWRAILALRAAGVKRAEAKAAIDASTDLRKTDRELLSTLQKRFGSDEPSERESAAEAVRALVIRVDAGAYRESIRPVLEALLPSADAEVRIQARALLRWYRPERSAAGAATVAARLLALDP